MRNQSTPLSVLIDDYRVAIDAHLRPRTVVGYQKALRELERLLAETNVMPTGGKSACRANDKGYPVPCVAEVIGVPVGITLADFTIDAVARVIARKRQTSASNARLIAAVAKVFSKVPSVYIDELRFEDIQRKPSPMTAYLRRSA